MNDIYAKQEYAAYTIAARVKNPPPFEALPENERDGWKALAANDYEAYYEHEHRKACEEIRQLKARIQQLEKEHKPTATNKQLRETIEALKAQIAEFDASVTPKPAPKPRRKKS